MRIVQVDKILADQSKTIDKTALVNVSIPSGPR